MDIEEFGELVLQYKKRTGKETFTSFGLSYEDREKAAKQMNAYLSGKRKQPVTNESLGVRGEGFYD